MDAMHVLASAGFSCALLQRVGCTVAIVIGVYFVLVREGCSMAFLMRVNWAFRGFNRSHHVPLFGDATMPVSRTWLSQGHYMVPCDTICASLYVFFLQRTYLRSLSLTLSYLQVDTVNDVWKFIGLFNSCLKWFSLRWSTVLETPRLWHLARISTRFSTV